MSERYFLVDTFFPLFTITVLPTEPFSPFLVF